MHSTNDSVCFSQGKEDSKEIDLDQKAITHDKTSKPKREKL